MDCEKAFEWMSAYLDKQLDKHCSEKLMEHIQNCEDCKKEFEMLKSMIEQLNVIPLVELPENYHEELMQKIQEIPKETIIEYPIKKEQSKKKWNWKKYSAVAAGFLILVVVGSSISVVQMGKEKNLSSGVSMAQTQDTSMEGAPSPTEDMAVQKQGYEIAADETENTLSKPTAKGQILQSPTADERKKIKTAYMSMIVKGFDNSIKKIQDTAINNGGYIENYSSNIYYSDQSKGIDLKEGTITLKMPSESYETIKNSLSEIGEIENINETTEDVTAQYLDTESKLKMKRIEEERLLELLGKSDSVEELLKIEERLGNVRTEIEGYTTAIQNWDRLVKYSTITISMTEKEENKINEVPSNDFTVQVKNAFVNSINFLIDFCQSTVIILATAIVPIVILAVLVVIILFIIKRKKKKN